MTGPANDALLVQLVRGDLGREAKDLDLSRVNISSCGFVVTLHGIVTCTEDRGVVEWVVGKTPGVAEVESKLNVECTT